MGGEEVPMDAPAPAPAVPTAYQPPAVPSAPQNRNVFVPGQAPQNPNVFQPLSTGREEPERLRAEHERVLRPWGRLEAQAQRLRALRADHAGAGVNSETHLELQTR